MKICQRKLNFYLYTQGCRSNQYDGEGISYILGKNKLKRVFDIKKADFLIILGCVVTSRAEKDTEKFIRKAKRINPEAKIALVGCLAERQIKEPISSIFFDYLIPNNQREFIFEILMGKGVEIFKEDEIFFAETLKMENRSRFFFKIQEGCNGNCAYCYVRVVRGEPRSLSMEKVLSHTRKLIQNKTKEIVFCGTHLGIYGRQDGYSLKDLVLEIEKIEGEFRFRFSSLEPWDLEKDLLEILKFSKKFCPFFHLPLQSGCDEVLKKMNRPYNTEFYFNLISEIKNNFPSVRIGADVIVGFPSEGEKEFLKTYDFIKKSPIDYLHIFTYSPRPNHNFFSTHSKEEIKERYKELKKLDREKRNEDMKRRENTFSEALTLGKRGILKENYWCIFEREEKRALLLPCKIVKWKDEKAIVEIL